MVGGDLQVLGRDEEEDIVLFPHDLDVRLIACADLIDRSLTGKVEAMAVKGSRSSVVQDRLVGEGDAEDGPEDKRRLPRT